MEQSNTIVASVSRTEWLLTGWSVSLATRIRVPPSCVYVLYFPTDLWCHVCFYLLHFLGFWEELVLNNQMPSKHKNYKLQSKITCFLSLKWSCSMLTCFPKSGSVHGNFKKSLRRKQFYFKVLQNEFNLNAYAEDLKPTSSVPHYSVVCDKMTSPQLSC